MAQARSKLDALMANDPEHPAIRTFIVSLEVICDVPMEDVDKITAIKHLLGKLEKYLAT